MKKKHTFIIGFMLGALLFGGFAYAAATLIEVHFVPLKYYYNGFKLNSIQGEEGFIYEGRTYVPLRFVSENMGKDVAWNGDNYQIDIADSEPSSQNTEIGNFEQLYSEMIIDCDWVYCFDSDSSSILRWQKNGTTKETFLTGVTGLLTVKDGWVYYYVRQKPTSSNCSIYRIGADSTNQEKITDAERLEWIYVTDDWIYTNNARFCTKTLEKQEYSYPITSYSKGEARYTPVYVLDNWVYCFQFQNTKRPFVKINLNNLQEKEVIYHDEDIIDNESIHALDDIDTYAYSDNCVYMSSGFVGVVNMLDLTTGELEEIDALASIPIYDFDVDGEWIYYENARDKHLYKSKLDGTQKTKLLKADEDVRDYEAIKVLDGRIYFARLMGDIENYGKSFWQFGSIDTNGKNLKIIE